MNSDRRSSLHVGKVRFDGRLRQSQSGHAVCFRQLLLNEFFSRSAGGTILASSIPFIKIEFKPIIISGIFHNTILCTLHFFKNSPQGFMWNKTLLPTSTYLSALFGKVSRCALL